MYGYYALEVLCVIIIIILLLLMLILLLLLNCQIPSLVAFVYA